MVDFRRSILAILDQNANIAGTGFLVNNRKILTCAHVIDDYIVDAKKEIFVKFVTNYTTKAILLEQYLRYQGEDIAILEIQNVPDEITPLSLVGAEEYRNTRNGEFSSLGYVKNSNADGISLSGKIDWLTYDNKLQLESINVGEGASGAPVWDLKNNAVIGMLERQPDKSKPLVWAIPAEKIWAACPELLPQSQSFQPISEIALQQYLNFESINNNEVSGISHGEFCQLHLTEKRLSPIELVSDYPYAIITADIGEGKSLLMQKLVREFNSIITSKFWVCPINFKSLHKDILSKTSSYDGLSLIFGKYSDLFLQNWEQGKLWLFIDEIDPLDENFSSFVLWINQLRLLNSEKRFGNRIWLNLRNQDYFFNKGIFTNWQELPLMLPTDPSIWKYVQTWRGTLEEKWGSFQNYWKSQLSPIDKQNLFLINLALKYFKDQYCPGAKINILSIQTEFFLKKILPVSSHQRTIMIQETNRLMINTLGHLWSAFTLNQWTEWDGNVKDLYFEQSHSVIFPDLNRLLANTLLRKREGKHYKVEYRWMMIYWLSESYKERVLEVQSETDLEDLANKLVALWKNQEFSDVAIYCLGVLADTPTWEVLFSVFEKNIKTIDANEEAERALRFLWLIHRQGNKFQQSKVVGLISYIFNQFVELDKNPINECEWALDDLALSDLPIPKELETRIPDYLIRRYAAIHNLVHEKQSSKLHEIREWLEILEQYPSRWAVNFVLKECISNKFDGFVSKRIFASFGSFLEGKELENHIADLESKLINDPRGFYDENPQRVILLLEMFGNRKRFTSIDFIRFMYEVAVQKSHNDLKMVLLGLMPLKELIEQLDWLLELLKQEKDLPVKEKILSCITQCHNPEVLETLLELPLDNRLRGQLVLALLGHYIEVEDAKGEKKTLEYLMTHKPLPILNEIVLLPQISPIIGQKIIAFYLNKKTKLTKKEASLLSRIYSDSGILEINPSTVSKDNYLQ